MVGVLPLELDKGRHTKNKSMSGPAFHPCFKLKQDPWPETYSTFPLLLDHTPPARHVG